MASSPSARMRQAGMIATANATVTSAKHSWNAAAALPAPYTDSRHSSRTARRLTPTAPPSWRTKFTPADAYASSVPVSDCTAPTLSAGISMPRPSAPDDERDRQRPERRQRAGEREEQARQREQHEPRDDHVAGGHAVGETAADGDRHRQREARQHEQVAGAAARCTRRRPARTPGRGTWCRRARAPYANATIAAAAKLRWRKSAQRSSGTRRAIAPRRRRRPSARAPAAAASATSHGDVQPSAVTDHRHVEQRDQRRRPAAGGPAVEAAHGRRARIRQEAERPARSPCAANGSDSRKIERQPNASTSAPPSAGPTAGASTMPKPKRPIARPRSSGGNTRNSATIAERLHDAGGRTLQHARGDQRLGVPRQRAEQRARRRTTPSPRRTCAARRSARCAHAVASIVVVVAARKPVDDPLHAVVADCELAHQRGKRDVDDRRREERRHRADHHRRDDRARSRPVDGGGGLLSAACGSAPSAARRSGVAAQRERERAAARPTGSPRPMPFDERVEARAAASRRRASAPPHAPRRALQRALALAPHARVAQRRGERRAGRAPPAATRASACTSSASCQTASVTGFAFRSQRGEDAQRARRVAGEPRFGQLEDVVARDVGDRALHRFVRRARPRAAAARASRSPAARRAGCLRTARRGTASVSRLRLLVLRARGARRSSAAARRARPDTRRSSTPASRERREPRRRLRRAIEARQRDQRHVVGIRMRPRSARAPCAPSTPGLPDGMRRSIELALAEEAHVGVGAEERVPVEAAARRRALRARRSRPRARRRGSRRRLRARAAARRRARRRAARRSRARCAARSSARELHRGRRRSGRLAAPPAAAARAAARRRSASRAAGAAPARRARAPRSR